MYHLHEELSLPYLAFPSLEAYPEVFHAFTTRKGGVSDGPYATLNLGLGSDDLRENVVANYHILADGLSLDLGNFVRGYQSHTVNIRTVTSENKGKLWSKEPEFMDVDGLLTKETGIVLMTFHADCIPLFFYDPVTKAIGMAHAGWRGTLDNMAGEMVRRFGQEYGTNPSDLIAVIGPALGQCCFEVDGDVADLFHSANPAHRAFIEARGEKYHIDLWGITKLQMEQSGMKTEQIEVSGLCTKCHQDLFFSHRGQNGLSGRMLGLMMLR